MDYSRLNGLRNFARSIGLNRLLTLPSRIRSARRMRAYEKNKPQTARFELEGYAIAMHVNNAYEWMRVQSFHEDRHIIGALKSRLGEGDTFWDIGASIGLYTNYLAKVVGAGGKVVAFEPEKRSREILLRNIELNDNRQVLVCPVALGKSAATLQMVLAEDASAGNHRLSDSAPDNAMLQEVQVFSADAYQGLQNIPHPQVVKIDVEGFEEDVIAGAQQILSHPACTALVVEVHFSILAAKGDNQAPQRMIKTLETYGFKQTKWLDPSHLIALK